MSKQDRVPDQLAKQLWKHRGQHRPAFAIEPDPWQESVWDYPRPPILVPDLRQVEVRAGDISIANSRRARRILETASPPTFYLPPDDVRMDRLTESSGSSSCEWKGKASYYDIVGDEGRVAQAAWSYEQPLDAFAEIAGWICFYPGRVACYIAGERVRDQAGGFYGGWVTNEIIGPYKGEPGTGGW